MGGVLSTQVNIHFLLSLIWEEYGQRMLRYILCPRWHLINLVNSCRDCILCLRWDGRIFVNTFWESFSVFAGTWGVWSTHFESHIANSLALDVFVNSCWDIHCVLAGKVGVLVDTYWETFFVLSGIGCFGSSRIEIHFVSSHAWDGFSHHILRYNLFPRCHGRGLISPIEILFVSSQAWEGFGNALRYWCWDASIVLVGTG